jgi:bifunctional NMN adenylyltransferase/nudix hydrolase
MKNKLEASAEVGIIVGRFQVPELHEVHKEIIQRVVDNHPRVLLFIGLAPDSCRCTYNNPLDYEARRAMIKHAFPSVEIHYVKDQPTDSNWSKDLDTQIHNFTGVGQKVVLYGGRDSFIPHYCGKYPVIELTASKIVSGKEIRKNVGIKSKNTAEFREGVVWAVENQWPAALPTVDIAIIDRKGRRVLLAKKPGETELRFVGGFASVGSLCYEDDAKREAQEETGLEVDNIIYLKSFKVDDWRYRSERNKIKTMFFVADYIFGAPVAADDIAEVHWVSFDNLRAAVVRPGHKPLRDCLVEYLTRNNLFSIRLENAK